MTKEKLPNGYSKWIKLEKEIAEEAYNSYKAQGARLKAQVGLKGKRLRVKDFQNFHLLRYVAAAMVVFAMGASIWVFRDQIFKPKYTGEQIDLAYQHTVKSLSVCSNSLSNELNKLQKLNEIPQSLDNLKKLENVIKN